MSTQEKITAQMKEAMRGGSKGRLAVLRSVKSSLTVETKKKGAKALSEDKVIQVIRKLSKQRAEAADLYRKGGRDDLAEKELFEKSILDEFLPSLASADQTRVWVQEAIDSGASNIGAVMGFVMRSHKSEVDGKLVRSIAQDLLK